MDQKKTGALIAEARKAKGLTQRQLSEQLHISDRTVSKWETGTGFPDVSLLSPLSDALGLSVLELIRGQRDDALSADAEERSRALLQVMDQEIRRRFRRLGRRLLAAAALFLCVLALCRGYTVYRSGGDPIDRVEAERTGCQAYLHDFLPEDSLNGTLMEVEIAAYGRSVRLTDRREIEALLSLLEQVEVGRRDRSVQAFDLNKTLFFTYRDGTVRYFTLPSMGMGTVGVEEPAFYFETSIDGGDVWEVLLPLLQPYFLKASS